MYENPRPDLKIKPCPFCGDNHIELRTNADESRHWVICDCCGAMVEEEGFSKAAALWNRRPREGGATLRLKKAHR